MKTIAEFLEGKTIFITGATGFLGQPLVEKILFVAPAVERIFVLIRPKHQFGGRVLTPQQRLQRELYDSSAFDRLRSVHGGFIQEFLEAKLHAVSGDISEKNLGLSDEQLSYFRKYLDIIINSAAVVSFDAPLDQALQLNVMSARRLARFASSCEKAILAHVSTAYVSGAMHKTADETMYHSAPPETRSDPFPKGMFSDPERDIARVKEIIQEVREEAYSPQIDREFKRRLLRRSKRRRKPARTMRRREKLESLRRKWLEQRLVEEGMAWARSRGWNDTYTYTKALGEQMVLAHRKQVPTVILRPSVIESSLSEPCPGWLDGLRMADPLIAAIGKGRLKSLPLDPDVLIDLVPVDVVVNALLGALPEVATKGGMEIYQVATGSQNPITLGELYELIHRYFVKNPMLDKTGRPIRIRRLRFPNPATFRFQHRLKAMPLNTAERTLERLSIFESTQKVKRRIAATKAAHQRLYYYGEIYEPYLNLDCRFTVHNTIRLFNSLSEEEQRKFNFDVTRLNWRHYIQNVHIPGIKKYILKIEGVGTMELEAVDSKLPVSTIPELLAYSADKYSSDVALQIKRAGEWSQFQYSEVKSLAEQVCARLQRLGFSKGERIVLYSENQPEWGIVYLGAVLAGMVIVPLDSQTWHREVWSVARFTDSRAILLSENCLKRFTTEQLEENEALTPPVLLLNVNLLGRGFDLEKYPASTRPSESAVETEVAIDPEDPVSIIFTSGTVADPKGAVHTHRNFLNNLAGVNRYLPIQASDSFLSVLPLYHALEFTCGFLMPIFGGARVTYTRTLKPRLILETMRETGTTCMLGVPTLYALIRDDIDRRILKISQSAFKSNLTATSKQLSKSVEKRFGKNIGRQLFARVDQEFGGKIRVFVSGGSALGEELYEDFNALGMPIYEGYGLTETAPVLTVNPKNLSRKGSAGKPLPGVEVRLAHPDRDGIGEIVVRTPSLMLEYFKNPEATARVVEEEWFHTGDLGWVDVDGYIYITGRTKDVIVTGAGKNVYPIDLEAIYSGLPSVRKICVLGIKSGLTEEVHAVIEPEPDIFDQVPPIQIKKTIQREVQQLARELPSYHRLQQIHIWPTGHPHTSTGEIDRSQVRDRLVEYLGREKTPDVDAPAIDNSGNRPQLFKELSRLSGLPVEEITLESDLYTDLGLDSLMAIELLLFAESQFGISVSDERASQLHLVRELAAEFETPAETKPSVPLSLEARKPVTSSALAYSERSFLNKTALSLSFNWLKLVYQYYFDLEPRNQSNIPRGQAYILAANHSSHLDTGAIISAICCAVGTREAQRLHVLGARDYFFDSALKGWLVTHLLNVVPIERKETSLASLRLVKNILAQGEPVLIFPEGTRSRTGELQEFKPGLGLMAWELKVPIIPALIEGTYEALPAGRSWPGRHRVRVTFGTPLSMENYRSNGGRSTSDDLYRKIATDVQAAVAALADGSGR